MGNLKEDDREEDMSRLGAIGLICRSINHIWAHGGLFLSIAVLIVFPVAVLDEVGLALTRLDRVGIEPNFVTQWAAGNFTNVAVEPGMIIQMTAFGLAGGLLRMVVVPTIQYICIVYTVTSILTNRTVVLAGVAGAVRRLWRPTILTFLCFFALNFGLLGIGCVSMAALFLSSNSTLLLLASLALLLDVYLFVFVSFAFQIGNVVPILEDVYGWKALGKGWKLLKGKKWVAFRMNILSSLLVLAVTFLSNFFCQLILLLLGFSINSTPAFVVSDTIGIVMSSAGLILLVTTETFLYFSCKAFHQESITDSAFFQMQVMEGGYDQIPRHSESYDVEGAKETGSQLHSEKPLQHVVVVR